MGSQEMGPYKHTFKGELLETIIGLRGSRAHMFRLRTDWALAEARHIEETHLLELGAKITWVNTGNAGDNVIILSGDSASYLPINLTAQQNGDEQPLMPIFPEPTDPPRVLAFLGRFGGQEFFPVWLIIFRIFAGF